jgi:tRNA pseudouridine32 synthase/23S rRNA pseudouridine746 synthase
MPDDALPLVHVDDDLVVIDKPAGLLSVPGRGPDKADCAAARVQARFPDALVVHRLDMGTSGLLVFGRGPAAQRALSMAFEQRLTASATRPWWPAGRRRPKAASTCR